MEARPKAITLGSVSLLTLLGFAYFFHANFRTIQVQGDSMTPTFATGTRLLCSDAYWLIGDLRRGDIVVIEGDEPGSHMIKRVYQLENGKVDWLNIPDDYDMSNGEFQVPPGHVYLLGDNREVSEDSRKYGPVAYDKIIGKIVLKRWL